MLQIIFFCFASPLSVVVVSFRLCVYVDTFHLTKQYNAICNMPICAGYLFHAQIVRVTVCRYIYFTLTLLHIHTLLL